MGMGLSIGQVVLLASFSVLLASGQIFFKLAAQTSPSLTKLNSIVGLLSNPNFWVAGILYGFATVLWIYLLQRVPLTRAYPFVAIGFILVPLAGHLLFQETITGIYVLGVLLIIFGIYLTGFASD